MRNDLEVPAKELRRVLDLNIFSFETTDQVPPATDFIGQERAVRAIRLGVEIDSRDHNIFVAGHRGIRVSRVSVLIAELNKYAVNKATVAPPSLRDICSVYNFEANTNPRILTFGAGQGKEFASHMSGILDKLRKGIAAMANSEEYKKGKESIEAELYETNDRLIGSIRKEAVKFGFDVFVMRDNRTMRVMPSPKFVPEPKKSPKSKKSKEPEGPQPMGPEEYFALSPEEKAALEKYQAIFNKKMDAASKEFSGLHEKVQEDVNKLWRGMVSDYMADVFEPLMERYGTRAEVASFIQRLKNYVLDHSGFFSQGVDEASTQGDPFLPFRVNVILDNSGAKKIPVIFESHPNFANLFGRIGRTFAQGMSLTDHTKIEAGSLMRADGGILVLNAWDVLKSGAWDKLQKTLAYGLLKIEDPAHYYGFLSNDLAPEAVPINVRVVLVGEHMLYGVLSQFDPEFSSLFKVKAELDAEMPLTRENETAYAGFIAACCGKKLLPFDRSAVAKIMEHGFRLASRQDKLSTEFHKIKDLVIEANYWAVKAGVHAVGADNVKQALDSQHLRANLAQTKIQELIKGGKLLIDVDGKKVGQINALSVQSSGDYLFGVPSRITAQTFIGTKGVISIEREVKMSGPIHDKGVHTLEGYFRGQYGQEQRVSFSASLSFEQLYGGVEGDSASSTELYCLVSSLSNLPIKQSLAVTGSVNQKGEIQPIGGVNEKIEGFFDICNDRGLRGRQGVIIPHQNLKDLMLREDIVEACNDGRFHVFAIKTVDEGLELLTGVKSGTIHKRVNQRLSAMAGIMKEENKTDKENQ